MKTSMTMAEWKEEGKRRFGYDVLKWRFVCPSCGNVASVGDYHQFKDIGATPESALKECIGRYLPKDERGGLSKDHSNPKIKSPCDYAGYGLFKLSPVIVIGEEGETLYSFAFAEPEVAP